MIRSLSFRFVFSLLLRCSVLLGSTAIAARALALAPGDIAVLGFNADENTNLDGDAYQDARWAIVALVDIPSGTVVHITDAGIKEDGTFFVNAANEGHLTWTLTTTVSAGTVLVMDTADGSNFSDLNGATAGTGGLSDYGTVSGNLGGTTVAAGIPFNTAGDQIIIYQGTAGTTAVATFIYAFSTQQNGLLTGNGVWQTSSMVTASQQSFLPAGLVNGTTANALTTNVANASSGTGSTGSANYGFDNMVYQGTLTGTKSALLAAIATPSNWSGDNTAAFSIGVGGGFTFATNFTVVPPNTAPSFVGVITTLTVNQDSGATDIKSLLHVSDSDSSQTLTWSQSSAPSHGTLSLSSATASSGSTDVTPGGTITYTPTSGYSGSDSFTVQVSDGTATATRTISVTVNDTTAPTVSGVTASTANGTYKIGDVVSIQVLFDEAVTVTGTPTLALNSGGSASYASGSGSSTLTFSYTVGSGDSAADLDYSATNALALAGGTIKDAAGNNATLTLPTVGGGSSLGGQKNIVVDGVAPSVSSSTVPANATYATGQNLDFTVTYAEAVTVNTGGGTPYVAVTLSTGGSVQAAYVSGSGTTALIFRYAIASGNADSNGVAVASSITLNGGTIRDAAGNNAATTGLSFASTAGVLVDGVAPSVGSINRTGTTPTNATSITYSVTFSEDVSGVGTSDFALTTTGTAAGSIASVNAVNASTHTVTVNSVSGNGTLRLDLNASGTGIADTAGNAISSGFTAGQTYTIDTTAPAAPAIASVSADTGASSSDGITSDTTPTFSGTAEANSTVEVFHAADSLGTTTADGSGNWSHTVAAQVEGTHSITAKATDAAGNTSVASTVFSLTIDTTAPAAPVVTAITTDSGSSSTDGTTNDATLVISGTAAANASVEVLRDGNSLGTTTANGSGAWSYNHTGTTLSDGTYAFTAKATDSAGNTSSTSSAFNVTVDTTAPAAPVLTAITNDTGSSTTDEVTSDTTLVLSGTAESNSAVTVSRIGTGVLGTATADGSGAWSYDYTGTTLSAGDHTFTATATDAAGNAGSASASFIVTVDVDTPPVPAITGISADTGTDTTDGITNDPTLVIAGTAEANGTVTINRSGIGTPLGTATANGSGTWTYNYTATTLVDGSYIFTATTTDAAGNASSASGDFPVTIDTAAPAAPVISGISADTGSSSSDGITSDTTPLFSGTAEADTTVEVFRGATSLGTATADSNGDWSLTPTALAESSYSITATATDAAGNTSTASTSFSLTVDTTAPSAPAITAISNDTGTSSSDLITNDATLALSGTAEASSTVTISHSVAGVLGTATADGSGVWTFDYTGTMLTDGTHTFTATAADAAGNVGAVSAGLAVTVDTALPVITSATTAAGDYKSVFGGYTVTASGSATSFGASGLPVGLSINSGTGAISGTPTQSGSFTVTLNATDAAGNVGAATLTLNVAKADLTVSGVAVVSKPYDGIATAALDFSGALPVGVFSGDIVSLDPSGATGAYATTNVGSGIVVTVSGLALSGADAGHYALTQPSTTGSITQAAATVVLASLNQTYDASPKSITATTTPAGLSVGFTYDGSSTPPTNAGSYAVVGTINELNYAGSATGTLTIAKADQTVVFASVSGATINVPLTLSATASSGLGVTLTLVSGDATLVGTTLTVASATSDVVVQATQAGDANYNPGSGTLTISAANITKLTQIITFPEPLSRPATSGPVTLTATASSGLPVSFTLVSGPATLSGNTLTLTSRTGIIVVTASQAGNAIYDAAPSVTHQFRAVAIGPQVYFGDSDEGDRFACNISQDDSAGAIIGYIASSNQGFVFTFTPGGDGSFSGTATTFEAEQAAQASMSAMRAEGDDDAAQKTKDDVTVTIARATEGTFTVTGTVTDGVLTGTIVELGLSFTLDMEPQAGPSADVAGYYAAPTLDTSEGHVYAIVGTQNSLYVLAVTKDALVSGTTPLAGDYTFALAPSAEVSLAGQLGTEVQTVSGTITIAGETESFLGASSTTPRNDRLLNLSSRAHIGAAGEQTLIAGFVIGGSEPKSVLLRGVGPGLARFGVANPLAAPRLRLFDNTGRLLREVAGWGGDITLADIFESIGAFAYDANSQDAALVATLVPGVYTMHVSGNGATGVALAEIYDTSTTSTQQRLLNISSRGNVSGGEGVLIGGFVVGGNMPKRVLIRGVGPGLATYGIGAPLANPTLTLYSGGDVIARNDNWEAPIVIDESQTAATPSELAEAATATGAFALTSGSTDAALIVTLAPGPYTVHVDSASGTTGIALVEVYEIPE